MPYSTYSPGNGSPYAPTESQSHLSAYPPGGAFSAYPSNGDIAGGRRSGDSGFRPATPNKKGQYSDAVIDELESQNEEQVSEMSKKVRMLKDVSISRYQWLYCVIDSHMQLTSAIGDEIRDSTAFAEKMNDQFEGTRNRLRGTMNRMLLMAERTGIGWRIWLGFFVFIFLLFAYVWLF